MVLVPIRCPSCGASVDLEEGQTVVRCAYCQSTSYLPAPAAPPAPAAVRATPPRATSRSAVFVLMAIGALVIGGLAFLLSKGGITADYLQDATSVKGVLADDLGDKTRFVTMTLSGRHTYVEVLEDDGTIVAHRFDGGMPRSPDAKGKVDDVALARKSAFKLADVDFAVVGKIVAHAKKQVPKGEPQHVKLERRPPNQPDLLWSVVMEVSGEHRQLFYTPAGKPLVEEPIDFIAALGTAGMQRFVEKLPKKAQIVDVLLARDYALVEVIAPKSPRDTDRFRFYADGVVSAAMPQTSDGDEKELATQVFSLTDIDAKAVEAAVSDATKHLEGKVNQVTIRRHRGALMFLVYAKTDRGASRDASYDASGRRLPP